MDIVSKVRKGHIDAELARMILKQLDSGIASFGLPIESISFAMDDSLEQQVEYICSELEAVKANENEKAEVQALNIGTGIKIVTLLWTLLRLINQ